MKKIISGAGLGVMGLAAAAIAAAPMAAADTTNSGLTVTGTQWVVGQSYTLLANAGVGGLTAHFYDNGVEIGSVGTSLGQGSPGNVPVTWAWKPTTTGAHTITEKTMDPILGNVIGTEGPVTITVISQWDSVVGGIPGIGPVLGSLS
ncbi:hypothetical protein [Nocardia stercoris]|uniref:Uncharacterized protein n=1 Tax=Nocardia stercoris TaxID=2483361 RepID=A0A3M2KW45_9NOCA|nr:hypothetical protein [Nocardia stercoris]RMI28670.1 hypothetical protein EBN03_28915 [Nocardia stercoris]